MADITERTDEELQYLHGDGVIVEAVRRLRVATAKQQSAMERLTRWIIFLTVVLVVLTIVQVIFVIEAYSR